MKRWLWRSALVMLFAAGLLAPAQRGGRTGGLDGQTEDSKLPNGKSQQDEILKVEHQQNIKDAAALADLAQQLQQDLEKDDRYVVSMNTIKKTDEIEKLARKIRARLRHN